MDEWGWQELQPWLEPSFRPLFCIISGVTGGRTWAPAAAGVRRRFAPHQPRHAHAIDMAREGVALIVIQRQLDYSNLAITSVYLQGIDNAEITRNRPRPTRTNGPVSASLRL